LRSISLTEAGDGVSNVGVGADAEHEEEGEAAHGEGRDEEADPDCDAVVVRKVHHCPPQKGIAIRGSRGEASTAAEHTQTKTAGEARIETNRLIG
jgi:hypothetical protein